MHQRSRFTVPAESQLNDLFRCEYPKSRTKESRRPQRRRIRSRRRSTSATDAFGQEHSDFTTSSPTLNSTLHCHQKSLAAKGSIVTVLSLGTAITGFGGVGHFSLIPSAEFPRVKIFSGTANIALAQSMCDAINVPLGRCTVSTFPDGETFVKIEENVRGQDVFIIQSTSPPANQHLMEMFIMMDALRRASASRITAVMPFYGYARQDRKDQPRVAITAKLVANLLVAAGANRVLTMDLHAQQIQGFFDIPVDHLYAAPVIYEYLLKKNLENLVVVSPDVGGIKMAYAYAQRLDAELAIVAKRRKSPTETEATAVIGDIAGRNVLLVDDLTETAGTLTSAATLLKSKGAEKILACVSHALLTDLGVDRIKNSPIDELITTDTVRRPVYPGVNITTLSVATLLGEAVKRIHHNSSVTSLFEFKGGRTS